MLRLYLKIWNWDLIFGRTVKAISSLKKSTPISVPRSPICPACPDKWGSKLNKLDYSSAIDQEWWLYHTCFSLLPYSKMYIFIIAIVGATVKDNFTAPSGFCLWRDKHRIFVLNFDKFWPFIAKIIQTSDDTTQRFDFFSSFLYFVLLSYEYLNLFTVFSKYLT